MSSHAIWQGTASVKGSTESTRMILLTTCLLGLQLCWGLEMTYCMPYLLSLGLTKSGTSIVWIAAPLAGIITAPTIGSIADRSRSKWGRRRPFMVASSCIVIVCFWALGSAKEIVRAIKGKDDKNATIFLAVVSIWAVDFAINAMQWSSRALITDTLPTQKQQLGNLWASRMNAFGHLFGYAVGATDLRKVFGDFLGDTQFKQVALLSGFSLLAGVLVTCWATTEKVLITDGEDKKQTTIILEVPFRIYSAAKSMPPRMRKICWIQFFTWLGWFPFHFYGSTWVGEVYFRHEAPDHIKLSKDRTGDIGRIGSLALMAFSAVQCVASAVLPMLVRGPDDEASFTARPPPMLRPLVEKLEKMQAKKPDLAFVWNMAHAWFAAAMIVAPLVTSVRAASLLVAVCGVPWAVMTWAVFSYMGVEINRHTRSSQRRESIDSDKAETTGSSAAGGAPAGTYLGILNLFTAGPQLVASLVSMVIFRLVEPGRDAHHGHHGQQAAGNHVGHELKEMSKEGPNAIAVCLFLSSFAGMAAFHAAHRLRQTYKT